MLRYLTTEKQVENISVKSGSVNMQSGVDLMLSLFLYYEYVLLMMKEKGDNGIVSCGRI